MSKSSVLPYKREASEESLCLDLSACPVSRRYGRYLSQLVDGDDAVVGDERVKKSNRSAVVIFCRDHGL
jgi:hypothetical protein